MAALQGSAQFGGTGNSGALIVLPAGSARTVVRIKAPANQRVKVLGYGWFFDSTSNSAVPVQVQLGRISADGTFTPATPLPHGEELTETFQTAVGVNASAEPTYAGYLKTLATHPQLGYEYLAPEGQEIVLKGGGMFGIVMNAPVSVDARGYLLFEE